MSIGAVAANELEAIQAYLNYGITIRYNDVEQTMYDSNGVRVYPISYNGTTYVPIRAVSNMLDINVEWDGANNTVILGENTSEHDFINEFKPYYVGLSSEYVPTSDGKTVEIAGKTYDHWLLAYIYGKDFYYDLEGKYTTLTFKAYCPLSGIITRNINIYGDDGVVLASFKITGAELPKTYTVDVSGVNQLTIDGDNHYIFDAMIK